MENFTKDDLKPFMLIRLRDDTFRLVGNAHGKLVFFIPGSSADTIWGNAFTDQLYHVNNDGIYPHPYDVMAVYDTPVWIPDYCFLEADDRDLLWERKEVKEVTMAEVCEKFGCEIKIVEG